MTPAETPLDNPQAKTKNNILLPAFSLWQREMVRFFRQRDRVIGALGTPLVFWWLLGSGLGHSFQSEKGQGYLEYFYPGTIVMILLFTAIFSTISIIEDRREGFLQSCLVAPVGRLGLVLGKILGGTTLAFVQGVAFLLLAPLVGISLSFISLLWLGMAFFVTAFALTGLGFLLAWRLNSTQGFHAIMNLFLLPMWLLSGAVFPVTGTPSWLSWIMYINPLTYGVQAIRHGLYWSDAHGAGICALAITLMFALLTFVLSSFAVRKTTSGDLQ